MPLPAEVARCGACISQESPIDLCLAAVTYEYPWSDLVARYKFGTSPGWAQTLAQLMRTAPGAQAALERAELLLPMPLSTQRLRERGFNQALELARQLDPRKTRSRLLLRLRDTPAQSSLAREARLRNVRDAFGLAEGGAAELAGRQVMLVDDVMTSGASLTTAARVLRAGRGRPHQRTGARPNGIAVWPARRARRRCARRAATIRACSTSSSSIPRFRPTRAMSSACAPTRGARCTSLSLWVSRWRTG
jgi:ComF family protein